MAVPLRGAEREHLTVARLEVEDVPRPEHDEGDVGVLSRTAPAHASCHPEHIANELSNPARELHTFPESYTLQPSSEPSEITNVSSIPSGTLTASEWACESPTMATRRAERCGGTDGRGRGRRGGRHEGRLLAALRPVERIDRGVEPDEQGDGRRRPGEHLDADGSGGAPPPAERALAHRRLDEAVAQLGADDRDRHRGEEPADRTVGRPGEHEDRPMPQVQPVAALADRHERPPTEHGPHPDRRRMHDDHHGDEREQRHQREEPLVHVARGERGDRDDAGQQAESGAAGRIERPVVRDAAAATATAATRTPPPRPPAALRPA